MGSSNTLRAVLLLQVMSLAVLGWLVAERRADQAASAMMLERALEAADRARMQEAEGALAAARMTFDRASRLASRAGDLDWAERLADATDRLRGKELLGPAEPPRAHEVPVIRARAARLAGSDDPEDAAVAAALEILAHRASGALDAAVASARARLEGSELAAANPWLLWQNGLALLAARRPEESVKSLEPVARAWKAHGPVFLALGRAYIASQRREAAISAFQKAVEHGAGSDASMDLAQTFLGAGMYAEAMDPLRAVVRADGRRVEAVRLLASAHFHLQEFPRAAELYLQAHEFDAQPRTLLSAAIALHAGGNHLRALALLDRLVPSAAVIPEIRFERALVLSDLARKPEALDEFRKYIAVARDLPGEKVRVEKARAYLASVR